MFRQMMRLVVVGIVVVMIGISAAPAPADIIVQYNMNTPGSSNTTTPRPASTIAVDVTAGNFTPILNGVQSTSTDANWGVAFSASGNNAFMGGNRVGSMSGPGSTYWTFTVEPDPGYLIDFDTFAFNWISPNLTTGATEVAWDVRSSVDSFASSLGTQESSTANSTGSTSIDISSLGTLSELVEFRIYKYKISGGSVWGQMRVDDVTVNGQVQVIPEPSAALLAVIGALALAMVRRRK